MAKSFPIRLPKRGSGTELHWVALVLGTAVDRIRGVSKAMEEEAAAGGEKLQIRYTQSLTIDFQLAG